MRRRQRGSIQDALGIRDIGDGYLVRSDGVAVALLEMTPPDASLMDAAALAQFLAAYTAVLQTTTERMVLYTYAVAPDPRPIVHHWTTAMAHVPDFTSFTILRGWRDLLQESLTGAAAQPTVRWIVGVPSQAPEQPPSGTWGELTPTAIAGPPFYRSGTTEAAVELALLRARRVLHAFGSLGIDPPPRLLDADAITALAATALDPVRVAALPMLSDAGAARDLQRWSDDVDARNDEE